jgi:hypothetical protein
LKLKEKEATESQQLLKQRQKALKDLFALLPGVTGSKQAKEAIEGLKSSAKHNEDLLGSTQAELIEWENVGLSLLHSPDGRPPTPQEADIQAQQIVNAFKASVEKLAEFRKNRENRNFSPITSCVIMGNPGEPSKNSSKQPATSGMMPDPLSPEQVSTIWNQIPPLLRENVPIPENSVSLMEHLAQIGCIHPRQLHISLGEFSRNDWDENLALVEELTTRNGNQGTTIIQNTSNTRLFSISDVPKFKSTKEYSGYRETLQTFLESVDTPRPEQFRQALLRILASFEDPVAQAAQRGWDISRQVHATSWEITCQRFLSALDDKFEHQTILQDTKIEWMKVKPKEGSESPADFFNRYEAACTTLRAVQQRKNVPILSDSLAVERLLVVLPRYLTDDARRERLDLENMSLRDIRKHFEVTWTYLPKPSSKHATDSHYKAGNVRATPSYTPNGPNKETERQCGLICSYDTSPPVPQQFRGPLFPDPKDPSKSAENHKRRLACANAGVCMYCRRTEHEHKASGPRFKKVLPPSSARHTPAIQPTPLPESRQIEAPPTPAVD